LIRGFYGTWESLPHKTSGGKKLWGQRRVYSVIMERKSLPSGSVEFEVGNASDREMGVEKRTGGKARRKNGEKKPHTFIRPPRTKGTPPNERNSS